MPSSYFSSVIAGLTPQLVLTTSSMHEVGPQIKSRVTAKVLEDFAKGSSLAEVLDAAGYIQMLRQLQMKCAELTWETVPQMGEKAPILLQGLDVLLSYLERASTCFGGCHGGDHRAEFLTGRAVSSSQASLLLMSSGYYDEALSIIRSLGEIANLMAMFVADESQFERWKVLDEKIRRRDFAPVQVRCWLEQHSGILVIDKKRYAALSGYSIHASPDSLPQAHNEHGTAIVGPRYQQAGFLICLNELALPMAFIGVFSVKLIGVNAEIGRAVESISRIVVEHMGSVSTDQQGRPWFKLN